MNKRSAPPTIRRSALRLFVAGAALIGVSWAGSAGAGADPPDDPVPVATVAVDVTYQPEDERPTPVIVDELERSTVLSIRARNFEEDTTGRVSQCVEDVGRQCGNALVVRFDASGGATFQYLVTSDAVADGDDPCRLDGPRCTVELTVGDRSSVIDTIFIDEAASPGRLNVRPQTDLEPGETVTIAATAFPPGIELEATVCVAPATSGSRCGPPAPVIPMTTGADGSASASMTLDLAQVGAERIACGRRSACRVVVRSDRAVVRARPAALTFRDAPAARYSTGRVLVGLSAAVVLLATAGILVRTGDWGPPLEADGSSIDDVPFADLDAEADAFTAAELHQSEAGGL